MRSVSLSVARARAVGFIKFVSLINSLTSGKKMKYSTVLGVMFQILRNWYRALVSG